MKTLSEHLIEPMMFSLPYEGPEDFTYVAAEGFLRVDTNIVYDIKGKPPFSFLLANYPHNEGLRVSAVIAEFRKPISVIFENVKQKEVRINKGMTLGYFVYGLGVI